MMRSLFSEAFAIAAITVLFYVYAYFFEMGHSARFSYPAEVIGPTLSSFLGGWVVMFLLMITGFLQLNLQYWPHSGKWKVGFVVVLIAYTLLVLTVMAWKPRWGYATLAVSSAVAAILASFIYRRRAPQETKAPSNASATSDDFSRTFMMYDSRSRIPQYSIAFALVRYFGRDPLAYAFLFLVVAPLVCMYAGATKSIAQRDFYILSTLEGAEESELVVRMIDGIVISIPYDPTTQTYKKRMKVREVSELDERWLSPVRVDKLELDDSP